METYKILSLLIFTILAQISWAKPLDNIEHLKSKDLCLQKTKYEGMEPSEKDSLLSPSNQLLKLTLKAFQELSLKYAKRAKDISGYLLKDNDVLTSKSAKMLQFKQNLTKFEEKYTLCDGIDDLFDLVELYSNTTSFYYELDESSLDNDSKLILSLLRKYGSEDLDNEFEKFFNVFVKDFNNKFEELKEDLSKEKGAVGQKILDWFKDFKSLNDYDDKIAAFEKFFEFYDDEQD